MARTEMVTGQMSEDVLRCEEKPVIAGMALLIINAKTGDIWMVKERKDKPLTATVSGQWTVPLETMKQEEDVLDAVRGAMAEAFDDVDLDGNDIKDVLAARISHVRGNSMHEGLTTTHGGRTFELNYAVAIYDGPPLNAQPFNDEEVGEGTWRNAMSLLDADVRPFVRKIGRDFLGNGVFIDNLYRYHAFPEDRLPVFERGFSIRETYRNREELPDMQ